MLCTGIDDSVQVCFSDALRALETLSLDNREGHPVEQRSSGTPTLVKNDGSLRGQGVLAGSKEELQKRILLCATIVRKLCFQKDRLEARVRQLEKVVDGCSPSAAPAVDAASMRVHPSYLISATNLS